MNADEKLTIKQIAEETGLNEKTIRRWIKSGELPFVGYDLFRRRYLVARADLDAFIAKRTGKPEEGPKTD